MKYKILLFVLLAFVYAGCKDNHPENDDHANELSHEVHEHASEAGHEEPKLILTAYNSVLELFAESDPFIGSKESVILSHFTTLKDFKPLDSVAVTLKLITGNEKIEQTINNPQKKGIYSFTLTPERTGKSKLIYETNISGKLSIIEIPVEVYKTEEEADAAAEEQEINNPNSISFTKEKSWKIDFATEPVLKEKFGQVIQTTGQLMPSQSDEVVITAKTNGIVDIRSNNVLEGKNVSAGESILNITGSGMARNNSSVEFMEARSNYENAKAVYERQTGLAKDKIVSEKELLNSKREYETNKAIFDNLNQNFSSSGQIIKSPISGFIARVFKKNGEYIEAGQPVLSVIKNSNLLIRAEVQSRYSRYIKDLYSATIKSDNHLFTLDELNGKIISVGQSLSSDNFAIPVIIQVQGNGQFIPGEFVQLYLKCGNSLESLTVPNSALLEEQGLFFVFVQISPELFEKREVRTGATDGVKTEITGGLVQSERIVTKGAMLVKLSQASGALDPHAGHVH